MTDRPPAHYCATCKFVVIVQASRRIGYICDKTKIDAYAERANPDGCGRAGKNWAPKSDQG